MAPPQVNLNEKPPVPNVSEVEVTLSEGKKDLLLSSLTERYNDFTSDPLPPKEADAITPVIVTVDRSRALATAHHRRQQRRCRIACCASIAVLLVILLGVGAFCLAKRMRHRRHWRLTCGTKEGHHFPEHVTVDPERNLIRLAPNEHNNHAWEVLHEYNRGLIAFKNVTGKDCYIDRLNETFEQGYQRLQGYEITGHKMGQYLRVVGKPIELEVVRNIADINIYEHCGRDNVRYHWVIKVTETEIKKLPSNEYITV